MAFVQQENYNLRIFSDNDRVESISIGKEGHSYLIDNEECSIFRVTTENNVRNFTVISSWNDTEEGEKDTFLSLFPEYPYVIKYVGSSVKNLFLLVKTALTYNDLVEALSTNTPIPPENIEEHSRGTTRFFAQDNKVVAFASEIMISDNTIEYRVGDYEYAYIWNKTQDITSEINVYIPFYNTLKDILTLNPTKDKLLEIIDKLEDIPVNDHPKVIYEILKIEAYPLSKGIQIEDPSPNSPWIFIYVSGSNNLIRENVWNSMINIVSKYPNKFVYETEEGTEIDIPHIISECKIIRNLSDEVISFVREIENNLLIDMIKQRVEYLLSESSMKSYISSKTNDIIDEYRPIFDNTMNPFRSMIYNCMVHGFSLGEQTDDL